MCLRACPRVKVFNKIFDLTRLEWSAFNSLLSGALLCPAVSSFYILFTWDCNERVFATASRSVIQFRCIWSLNMVLFLFVYFYRSMNLLMLVCEHFLSVFRIGIEAYNCFHTQPGIFTSSSPSVFVFFSAAASCNAGTVFSVLSSPSLLLDPFMPTQLIF